MAPGSYHVVLVDRSEGRLTPGQVSIMRHALRRGAEIHVWSVPLEVRNAASVDVSILLDLAAQLALVIQTSSGKVAPPAQERPWHYIS
jgi:hypothetical protein